MHSKFFSKFLITFQYMDAQPLCVDSAKKKPKNQTQNTNKPEVQTNPKNMNISKILGKFICFAFKEPYNAI